MNVNEITGTYSKGDIIAGTLEVQTLCGIGGFGVVYVVRDRSTGQLLALKTFRSEITNDLSACMAFATEARRWLDLGDHRNIITARLIFREVMRLFVLMDYIAPDGAGRVSLGDHIAASKGPLPTEHLTKWAIEFCRGMEHANSKGIEAHRDIKPANILISGGTLKITDFGLAAASEAAAGSGNGQLNLQVATNPENHLSLARIEGKAVCGTPGYIAPEVYRCEGSTVRSDIYSFGLVLWQMATGSQRPPFFSQWRGAMEPFLRDIYNQQLACRLPLPPATLGRIISKCLDPNPNRRFSSFSDLAAAIAPHSKSTKVLSHPEDSATFWHNRGNSLASLDDHEQAIACFDKAIKLDSSYVPSWLAKGSALLPLGKSNEALACFEKALTLDPTAAEAWYLRVEPLVRLARRARKHDPQLRLRLYEEAIASCDRSLKLEPTATVWLSKGELVEKLGRHQEAIGCYREALKIDPANVLASQYLEQISGTNG